MKQIPSNFGSDWQNPRLLEGGGPVIELGPHPVRPANAAAPAVARTSYWRLAWDHKLLLIGFLLLGGIAGTAYVTFKRPLYRATATVEVVGFNQSFMGMNQVDPQAGTDITTASVSNIQTQSRILTSRNLVSRVVERMSLEMTPLNTTPSTFFTRLRSRLPFGNAEPLAQIRTDVATAAMSVTARGVIATRLIELQCESPSPEVSANFVNTLIAEHASQTVAARANLTQRTSQWMESQLEESKFRLQQAGEKLRQFVANSGTDFFLDQTTLADSKLRQLQSNVAAIQADRIGKQSRWELVKNSPVENIGDVIADGNLESMKARVADLKRERAQLTTTLTDENPKVTKVQAQINEIEGTLQKEKVSLKKRIQAEYEEAQKREKLLLEAYNRQTHTVSGQADKAAQYSMLKRDVEMEQQLYNMLLQQSSQAALIALAPSSSIRVVDPALPSSFPSSPAPTRDIPTGVMLGGGVGFGLLVLLDITKKKKLAALFNTPGHTQTLLGVPELGVIPSAELDRPRKRLPAWPGRVIDTGENGDSEPELVRWQSNKASLLAESFRQTLVSILGTRPKDHNPIYVIASAGPSEGKTTLCANLAAAMADIGHRVLVIDADLRRSHLHSLFGVNGGRGLGDILVGSEPVAKLDLSEYTHPSPTANLSVMPHGRAEFDTPALLFFSERTQQLISLLQSRYDCIFFDTPPSLAFPDARLLGKHSDGVVLVVRAGITSRETAAAACQRFLSDGIPVLGTILNDWKPTDNRQYGAYYYGNGAYNKK